MTGKSHDGNAVPVSDLAAGVIDPVLQRRAGMTLGLIQSWEEIAGPRLAETTRPERIAWAKRRTDDDPFEPATLVVACEGVAALHLQHETGEVIARVNAFLGFAAIGRVKIVQKPVAPPRRQPPRQRQLDAEETRRIDQMVGGIENEGLRAALTRLGRSVIASRG